MRNFLNKLSFGLLFSATLLFSENSRGYEEIKDQSTLNILTPSLKKRKTAKIRLDNGLEVYLISDPKADQSAAAFSMEVGSWNDHPKYPGTAHFLEHLLFMGSKAYPEENSYEKQVLDNGGTFNAYTAPDRTVYIFSVNNDAFPLTLDMFSHMFIDPLFSPSGIGRELHAVDQEHDKNIESDQSRLWMIFKETGNPSHPNALFSTGNAQTLGGIPQKEVIAWHQANYSSDRAHLIIYSTLPIEELKGMTTRFFSKVPRSLSPKKVVHEPLFSEKQTGHIIAVNPIQELRELSIEWELPPEYVENLDNNAHALLGYALEGRHPSSLYSELKKEELIENMSSGSMRISKDSALFSISFTLTPQGAKQFEIVLQKCFQTLNRFKDTGIPPYIFQEIKMMDQINYEYQSRISPYAFVSMHASKMIDEPLETYPLRTVLKTTYDAQKNQIFLENLTPEKATYLLIASPNLTGISPDKKEKWSGAEYGIKKIPTELLALWHEIPSHPKVTLPPQNPFIPSHLKLVTQVENEQIEVSPIPTKLIDHENGTLFVWEDTQYQVPEVSWILNIASPLIDESTKSSVLLDLYCYSLNERLASSLTFANAASLELTTSTNELKLQISINGYSEKAPLLLEIALNKAKNCTITKEEFNLYTTSLRSNYGNQGKAMPIMQAYEITRNFLFNNAPTHTEKLSALKELTYEDYLAFANRLFQEAHVEGILAGNLTGVDAQNVWKIIQNTLTYAPYPKKIHEKKQMLTLSPFQGPYKIQEKTTSLGSAALLVIQEGPMTFPKKGSHVILGTALQEDFFDTLRTKQQTGYITKTAALEEEGQLYNLFMVQSTTHQPDELIARFELFLETYVKDFESMLPEGRFEVLRSNVITLVDTPPTNLKQMAVQLNNLAFIHKDFERKEKLLAALKNLTYEDFKADTITFLSRRNPKRIAIMLEGEQPKDKTFRYEPISSDALKAEGTYLSLPN